MVIPTGLLWQMVSTPRLYFRFPFSYYIENGIAASIFVFRFPAILYNIILIATSFMRLSFL